MKDDINPYKISSTPCLGDSWCGYCAKELNINKFVIGVSCDRGKFWDEMHLRTFFIPAHFSVIKNLALKTNQTICTWCNMHHTLEEAEELNKKERENAEKCHCPNCVKA